MLIIAAWVRWDSEGPVLFRQTRVGLNGRPFSILKFRTMRPESEELGQLTVGADARITRAGRVLRRTKLDELPQLFNVAIGDMSLVGPRPEVPRFVEEYPAAIRSKVLSVRPGITAPASLSYFDEADLLGKAEDPDREYREQVLPAKLESYVRYVDERTMWGDLKIVMKTAVMIITKAAGG